MRFTNVPLTVLLVTSTTLALPTSSSSPNKEAPTKRGVAPNTQSCTCRDNFTWVSYSTDIGITYANGIGCNDVFNAINSVTDGIWNYQCVPDDQGNTQLWFNTDSYQAAKINGALLSMYPTIEGGFNCPDY